MPILSLPPHPVAPTGSRWLRAACAAAGLAATAVLPLPAQANDTLVRFDGGIGSQPLRSGGTPPGLSPCTTLGVPWVIESLKADVRTDGRIRVSGRGLLLGGGDNIGTTGGQSVRARLYCAGVASDTKVVALEADGDFRIDDALVPTPPSICNTPILLILNPNNAWFAAGIPKR
jgi:hypothetical protein